MTAVKSIREIHDAFDKKVITPVELTKSFLSAAKASDHNAYLTFCDERAISKAQQAEKILAEFGGKVPRDKFPLLGIPLGIKDALTVE